MALANADLSTLKTTATDFRQVQAPAAVTVSGHRSIKFVYQWTAGTSAVTGKANVLITARYYVTKDVAGSTLRCLSLVELLREE